jgi:hypothetical protein
MDFNPEGPVRHPYPLGGVQFGLRTVLHHSITPSLHHSTTPSLRAAGFEDEDDDENEALTAPPTALPNILPRAPKSVEELSIQIRPDLLDCFYHRLSRFFG